MKTVSGFIKDSINAVFKCKCVIFLKVFSSGLTHKVSAVLHNVLCIVTLRGCQQTLLPVTISRPLDAQVPTYISHNSSK